MMPTYSKFLICLFIISMVISSGCSSGGKSPLAPDPQNDEITIAQYDEDGVTTGQALIGLWDVILDPKDLSAELVKPRISSAIGDAFYVDITFFLTGSPCVDCLRVKSMALDSNNHVVMEIGVRHPFNPAARLDLHVFDLRALVAWKNATDLVTFPGVQADINGDGNPDGPVSGYDDFLLNYDGFSTIFDAIVEPNLGQSFPGNLVPFVNLFVDPSRGNYDPVAAPETGFTDPTHPTGQNVFAMGAPEQVKQLIFNLPAGSMQEFTIALECAYGQSATRPSRMHPKYFLPEFHRKEAHTVSVTMESNDLKEGDTSSTANLKVSVFDWQAGLTPPPGGFDPATSTLDSIRHQSDVKEVAMDIPGIISSPIIISTPDGGTGSYTDPYIFQFVLTNILGADNGTYVGLVAVKDQLMDLVPGGNNKPPIGIERDGLTQHTFRDFCVYTMFEIDVQEVIIQPPDAIISEPPDDETIPSGTWVHFDGSTSFPPSLPPANYEWDFNYDDVGQVFTPDGTDKTIDHLFTNMTDNPVTWVVAFRVTDLQLRTDIDTVKITVSPAAWGNPIRLTFTPNQDDTISLSGNAIAVDSNNKVHVIYAEKAIAPDPANTFRIKYVTYDGITVSSPVVISGSSPFTTPMFGLPQPASQLPGPSIAIDSQNNLYAVWTDSTGIRYAQTQGGTWSPTIQVFDLDTNPDITPTITINPDDKIMIAWTSRRYNYFDDTKPKPKVHYAYGNASGVAPATLVEFNNKVGGEPYIASMGQSGFALVYADDNPSTPGADSDLFIAKFNGSWDTPAPIPLDMPNVLRGHIGAKKGSADLSVVWSDVLVNPATVKFKHYTADISSWTPDYKAYDDAMALSLPSPIRLEVLENGTVFLMWSDTIASKERCIWVSFSENDNETTILQETALEIDPINPVGERQLNSTNRNGAIHVIWQDLRDSTNPPGDPLQEIYYCKYR